MTKLELHAKSDRELLILIAQRQEDDHEMLKDHHKFIYGNGKIGIKTQMYVIWGAFITLLVAIIDIYVKRF